MKTRMGILIAANLVVATGHSDAKPLDAKPLAEIAKRHQVPMPSNDARLVLAHTETWSCLGNQSTSRDPGIYSPAYLLKQDPDGSIQILRGAEQETLHARQNQEPLWRPFSAAEVTPQPGGHVSDFSRLSAFVCAVQTAERGDIDAALREMSGEKGPFQGPCAGFTIPRLAVRDLATMKLASLLGMKEAPDEFWTNDQWGALRQEVAKHLKDQKLPEL